VTGEYKGAACSRCNLSFKPRKGKSKFSRQDAFFIPVILHGGSNYDFQTHPPRLYHFFSAKDISVIPNNTERYIGFEIGNFRCIDSCKFLNASLEALVENLQRSGKDKFYFTGQSFNGSDSVFRKGVFPYEYMDNIERFFETELPPRSAFYSQLNDRELSEEDYAVAQEAWAEFGCRTLKHYHDHYLKLDVTLLADVFENFS